MESLLYKGEEASLITHFNCDVVSTMYRFKIRIRVTGLKDKFFVIKIVFML